VGTAVGNAGQRKIGDREKSEVFSGSPQTLSWQPPRKRVSAKKDIHLCVQRDANNQAPLKSPRLDLRGSPFCRITFSWRTQRSHDRREKAKFWWVAIRRARNLTNGPLKENPDIQHQKKTSNEMKLDQEICASKRHGRVQRHFKCTHVGKPKHSKGSTGETLSRQGIKRGSTSPRGFTVVRSLSQGGKKGWKGRKSKTSYALE